LTAEVWQPTNHNVLACVEESSTRYLQGKAKIWNNTMGCIVKKSTLNT